MRCFVAITLPEEIRKEILKIQEMFEKSGFVEGKMTEFENIHLTLKFLGEIDETKIGLVKEKLHEVKWKSFEASLGEAGTFSNRIIWIKLKGVGDLQRKVDNSLKGIFSPEQRFMSHITISRIKRILDRNKLMKILDTINLDGLKFEVDKFYLMESKLTKRGPTYSILGEFKTNGE